MTIPAVAVAAALLGVPALGQTDPIRGSAAPVTIFTRFEHRQSPATFEVMKVELASIMSSTGIEFEWRSLDTTHGGGPAVELVVVTFRGSCRMEEIPPFRSHPGALGWTHISDGVVLPFSEIDCDSIRAFIARRVVDARLHERETILGRALGRVLAHELYHVFAKTMAHGKRGIAKPVYNAAELVAEKFLFEQKESRALKTLALPALIRARGPAVPVSALAPR
jgi:hypothetical protein